MSKAAEKPPGKIRKYDLDWDDRYSQVGIELKMIAKGGKYLGKGLGLFEHMMRARELLWPERYRHRWTELMYQNFIENDVTVLLGCASSQKTSHASEFVLINYLARPNNTLVILSTVNNEKLDIGVWAEVKMLWQEARDRWDDLAGNLVEYKRAIATDNIEEKSRDFRKGIIGRPCVPTGSLVDTPKGKVPIEKIKVGDFVVNASGCGRVKQVMSRPANQLVRIHLSDGRELDCTPDHPVLTGLGWKKAVDVETLDVVFSAGETLSILREEHGGNVSKPEMVLRGMFKINRCLQTVWEKVSNGRAWEKHYQVLQLRMRDGMEKKECSSKTLDRQEMRGLRSIDEVLPFKQDVLFNEVSGLRGPSKMPLVQGVLSTAEEEINRRQRKILQSILRSEMEPEVEVGRKEKTHTTNRGGDDGVEYVPARCSVELPRASNERKIGRSEELVQNRHSVSRDKVSGGVGRSLPPDGQRNRPRQEQRWTAKGTRVDRVEILESSGDPRFKVSEGGYTVHNLEVEGHPSYSVNGVIVHNCYSGGRWQGLGVLAGTKQDYIFYLADELQFMQEAFSASWPHLFSNGTVKIIGSGNPKHDDGDELAKTAEPVEGWAAMPEPQKTSVWKTKFMGAKAVNLVGTDSPNFDVPEDAPIPFPRLISRQFANRIEHDFGKDSFQYYQLVKGVMRVAFAHSRVITRQLCRDHHAMENVEWSGSNQTMIYGLDPCYGGDDRCVGRWLKFGDDTTGHQILQLGPVEVFKVNLTKKQDAEDQIAEMVAERLDSLKIKPEDCFYDSFGKGTLGAAFARKFGFRVPTAVDAGGSPTERPVRDDLYMYEKDGSKRLKTCREHYKYFVSELWFSWRYTIEADQMRGLDEPTMAEGCARIYEMVEGNKIQVEPKSDPKKKEDLKRRLGKSPDLADCTVIGVEGARQRGFRISRLGAKVEGVEKEVDFFDQEVREYERTLKKFTLVH